MTIPVALFLVAIILALVAEFQAEGKSILGWAVVVICIGLLWGRIP
jgi:Na+/citrate or Na+/malate symporter